MISIFPEVNSKSNFVYLCLQVILGKLNASDYGMGQSNKNMHYVPDGGELAKFKTAEELWSFIENFRVTGWDFEHRYNSWKDTSKGRYLGNGNILTFIDSFHLLSKTEQHVTDGEKNYSVYKLNVNPQKFRSVSNLVDFIVNRESELKSGTIVQDDSIPGWNDIKEYNYNSKVNYNIRYFDKYLQKYYNSEYSKELKTKEELQQEEQKLIQNEKEAEA